MQGSAPVPPKEEPHKASLPYQPKRHSLMATPIDVPRDGDEEQPTVTVTTRRIRVRGVYVLEPPNAYAEPRENRRNARPTSRRRTQEEQERPVFAVIRRREYYQRSPPRFCYCFLLWPFLLAFGALILAMMTFVIENEEVKRKCSNITCALSCGESPQEDCWVIIGIGAGLCVLAGIYTLSLLIRMCYKSKW